MKRMGRGRREQKQTVRERPRGGAVRGAGEVRHRRDGRADDQQDGGHREPHEEQDDAPGEGRGGACGSARR